MTEISILEAWRVRAGIGRATFARVAGLSETELARIETDGVCALTPQTESAIEAVFFGDHGARLLVRPFLGSAELLNRMDDAFSDATRAMIRRQELRGARAI